MCRLAVSASRIVITTARPVCTTAFLPCRAATWQRTRSLLSGAAPATTIRHFSSQDERVAPFSGLQDTIYALSTAQGKAGIAVIRISGPSCLDIYKHLCPGKKKPRPRYAAVRTLHHPRPDGAVSVVLDANALVLYFPAPATVTGEDVLELHVHGGLATVKAVLASIPHCSVATTTTSSRSGGIIRYAEPGEFTKRAFLHDRLDLAQVESLSDTLAAETEQQRRAAVRGSGGALGRTYERWRQQLLSARGELEALIDFSEDQHFDESPADLLASVRTQVADMLRGIRLHERGSRKSELLRGGVRIALVGPPNAGKSSLMNLVVGREASIVSGEAGTTRDVVEARLDIRGYLCSFADTAGLRTAGGRASSGDAPIGKVEEEGIRRARQKAREADVVIALASVETREGGDGVYIRYDEQTLDLAAEADEGMVVVNKTDTTDASTMRKLLSDFESKIRDRGGKSAGLSIHTVSCKDAAAATTPTTPTTPTTTTTRDKEQDMDPGSVHALIDALGARLASMTTMPPDLQDLLGVTERQRQLLARCRGHLEEFAAEAAAPGDDRDGEREGGGADIVVAAEFLRYAADCLARITGRGDVSDVEDVLGVVFEKFCVGK